MVFIAVDAASGSQRWRSDSWFAEIGLIAGIPIGNSQKCPSFDYTCYPAVSGAAVGAVVGAVVGAAIGAGIRSWHLRYP